MKIIAAYVDAYEAMNNMVENNTGHSMLFMLSFVCVVGSAYLMFLMWSRKST